MRGPNSPCNIFLTGFSAAGKSSIGPRVAAALGFEYFDTDAEICRIAGKPIDDIFKQDGEPQFRAMEKRALGIASTRQNAVIPTGGGAVVDSDNRLLMSNSGMVVFLEARPETILRRLQADVAGGGPVRPLLAVSDPLGRITELKEKRQSFYACSDWTVHTDDLTPEEVVQEVIRGWRYWSRARCAGNVAGESVSATVTTATQNYSIWVGWDILETVGQKMAGLGLRGAAYIVTDETVASLYGQRTAQFLKDAGFRTETLALPPGETAKNMESVARIYDFLVSHRAERGDTVVALGGGVVGDTAGFAAATFNRGMRLVQVPTTLVGMVDSSIGGKVGVDHPRGKNLIGAFYQPCLVVSDVQLLTTLPMRELSSGWAEVVKHGLIADAVYFQSMEQNGASLKSLEREIVTRIISKSVAIKADIVSRDEKETTGLRTLLNYGHTIAHGIEAATGYGKYLHGEAVAIGMVGAALLAWKLGIAGPDLVERHRSVLKQLGLPVDCRDASKADVLKAMKLDKKIDQGAIRWVLLKDVGCTVVRKDVPAELVEGVLADLGLG